MGPVTQFSHHFRSTHHKMNENLLMFLGFSLLCLLFNARILYADFKRLNLVHILDAWAYKHIIPYRRRVMRKAHLEQRLSYVIDNPNRLAHHWNCVPELHHERYPANEVLSTPIAFATRIEQTSPTLKTIKCDCPRCRARRLDWSTKTPTTPVVEHHGAD